MSGKALTCDHLFVRLHKHNKVGYHCTRLCTSYLIPGWINLPYMQNSLCLPRLSCSTCLRDLASSHQEFFKAELPEDGATVVQFPSCVIHEYDFHIAYSFSYRTPVLYFHGRQSDGQPLDLDDIQKDLPEYSLKLLRESKWTFITLEDHPFLHRPWYMLHPCGTSEWMRLLLSGVQQENPCAVNYLVSWLSVVGQAVGLSIPASLTTSCFIDCSSSSIA